MFSTILSPSISSIAPNFDDSFNFLATYPSSPSNHIAIAVKTNASIYVFTPVKNKRIIANNAINILEIVIIFAIKSLFPFSNLLSFCS